MRHVLILPSWYRSPASPGNGSYVREQALALRSRGDRVGVIYNNLVYWNAVRAQRKTLRWRIEAYEDCGIPTYTVDTVQFPRLSPLNDLRNRVAWRRLMKRYVRRHGRPDLLHAHSFYPGDALARLKEEFAIPYVVTEHWSGFHSPARAADSLKRIRAAYGAASRVIAVSDSLAANVEHVSGVRCLQLPNCTDFSRFHISAEKFPTFTFVAAGYFSPIKRYDLLLRAFARLGNDDARLLMIGDGALDADLRALSKALKIGARVDFVGRKSREEVAQLLAKSHVLVSSSAYETFGMTLIEALASGTPAVAIRSGGPASILSDPALGILAGDSEDELVAALRAARSQAPAADPSRIRAKAFARFSEEAVIPQLQTIYDRVLEEYGT